MAVIEREYSYESATIFLIVFAVLYGLYLIYFVFFVLKPFASTPTSVINRIVNPLVATELSRLTKAASKNSA
jgi:hypothetical protein